MLGTSGTCLKPLSCKSSSLFLPNHKGLIYFRFLIPELVEYCVEQITFHLQRFKIKKRHKHREMKNKHHETVEGWGTPRQTRPGTRRTCQSMLTGLEDLDLRRWGAFSPLPIPHRIGTFTYFVRRWGLEKNLLSPLKFDMKLLKVRAKGMEAIKLRIQEVRLKRPDIISKIFWRSRKGNFKGNIALKVFGSHWVLLSLEEVASLMEEVKLEANNHLENHVTHNVHRFP